MAVKCVEYTILVYAIGVPVSKRTWTGNDFEDAIRNLTELRQKFPDCSVRFSVSTYFEPITPAVPRSVPPSTRRADLEGLASGG